MAAYEQLYRAHKDPLLQRIIRPRVGAGADADDVLVETFTVGLEKLGQFTWTGRSLFGWLARIAINKCHDTGRGLARDERKRSALKHEPVPPPPRADEALARLADAALAGERVQEILQLINPRYAKALRLRLLEGRSRDDCAALLEVKLGTFDVVLLRATRAFRARWTERYGEEDNGTNDRR